MTTINSKNFSKRIHGVAFDMDGLIFDSEKIYKTACMQTAESFSLSLTDDFYKQLIGTPVARGREIFKAEFGEDFPIDDFQAGWKANRLAIVKNDGMEFKPGFESLFAHLKSLSMPIALVTASFASDVRLNFGDSHIVSQLDCIITNDDPYPSKPAPDKYLAAAKHLGISASHMLVCEDSNTGMQAAINAKTIAVMVPDLLPPSEDVKNRASKIVESLSQLHLMLTDSN